MDSLIELHIDGGWTRAAAISVSARQLRFEYLPEYVFADTPRPRVAIGLPVDMEIGVAHPRARATALAFLWDVVPQGRGRQHLANLVGVSAEDSAQDLFLAQHGAFAPIGRLRLDTAVDFYRTQVAAEAAAGFTTEDMTQRTDRFLDQLAIHGMLAAGTPGVQGVAPKFLLAQDEDARWYPDVALPDARARGHWLVKLPRGREAADMRVLRNEAAYLGAAAVIGLRSIAAPRFEGGMLFLPRFDRRVDGDGVVRIHQETMASLMGLAGFGRSASLFDVTRRLADVATDPVAEVVEFLCRDVLNRALRNPDNHLRNTSVQQLPDGRIQLTPLYDIGPMYLDRELITRTCHWSAPDGRIVDDWNEILDRVEMATADRQAVAAALRRFGEIALPRLEACLVDQGADRRVVDDCLPSIADQFHRLSEIQHADADPETP